MGDKVTIYTINQLNLDGTTPIIGGHERYMRDIGLLMKSMGYQVEFFQMGNTDWYRDYLGMPIRGFKTQNNIIPVHEYDKNSSEKILYAWYGVTSRFKYKGISMSHGIWFDNPNFDENYVKTNVVPMIKSALDGSAYLTSVDTGFINFCRGTFPNQIDNKLQYIPNYVDTDKFKPKDKTKDKDKITILYPRRLDPARGIFQIQNIANKVLERYKHVRFSFAIDKNNESFWNQFEQWYNSSPNRDRIEYQTFSMDAMPIAYQECDIVVIPTQWAEGTSLSCLEAMAMGKPILTTVVGGLTDLILNEYNGLLVDTSEVSILNGLCRLIEDKDLRDRLGANAHSVAQKFSKTKWEDTWSKLIQKVY